VPEMLRGDNLWYLYCRVCGNAIGLPQRQRRWPSAKENDICSSCRSRAAALPEPPKDVASYVYVAGPMSFRKDTDWNFPMFHLYSSLWRERGWKVANPAETDGGDTSQPREYYLAKDVRLVTRCYGIVLLDGWEKSEGAKLELAVAQALGKKVYTQDGGGVTPSLVRVLLDAYDWRNDKFDLEKESPPPPTETRVKKPEEPSILDVANRLVNGDRNKAYGPPQEDFSRQARMWEVVFSLPPGSIKPEQVGLAMVCVKVCRELHRHKRDNLIDGVGYFLTVDKIRKWREEGESDESEKLDSTGNCDFDCGPYCCGERLR
jgi:hypothetical protein